MANHTETHPKFTKEINGIYIDPIIFTYKFSCKCSGECCNYGVYIDLKEHDFILSIKDKILPMFDESQTKNISKWFEAPEEDEDFDSGVAVGTEIINGKCTFLDKNGLCTLQKLAMNEGEPKWKYKPLYCILFPLTVYEGALTIDDDHIDRLKTCSKDPIIETSIYDACKEELIHFFGEEKFMELEDYKNEYLSENLSGVEKK
jgi:Fe-S-cluster containining protein